MLGCLWPAQHLFPFQSRGWELPFPRITCSQEIWSMKEKDSHCSLEALQADVQMWACKQLPGELLERHRRQGCRLMWFIGASQWPLHEPLKTSSSGVASMPFPPLPSNSRASLRVLVFNPFVLGTHRVTSDFVIDSSPVNESYMWIVLMSIFAPNHKHYVVTGTISVMCDCLPRY